MADFKDHLTTEDLSNKYTNQFELVAYAIKLAENMLKTGRDPRVKTDVQNRALQILEEIATGRDYFDEIVVAPEPVEAIFSTRTSPVIERNIVDKDFESERVRPKSKSKSSNALLDDKKSKRSSSRRALAK